MNCLLVVLSSLFLSLLCPLHGGPKHLASVPLAGFLVLLSLSACSFASFLPTVLPSSLPSFLPSSPLPSSLLFSCLLACFSVLLFPSPPRILVLNNTGTTSLEHLTPVPIFRGLTHSSRLVTSMSPNLMVSHQVLINLTQQQHLIQSNHSLRETYSSLGF